MPQIKSKVLRNYTKARLAWRLIVVSVICSGSGCVALAQQKVGYVLEMEGQWTVAGTAERLNMGQSVAGGIVLAASNPADGDHIVIANLHGDIIKQIRCTSVVCRECRESGACYDPIQPLPSISESASTIATVFNAVVELFAGKVDRYSIHRARGSGLAMPRNAVVRLDRSVVDVSAFLEGQERGLYEFQFVLLSGQGSNRQERKSSLNSFDWNTGGKSVFAIEGVHPGLYEMRISRGGQTSSAWVLLCNAASYSASAAAFDTFAHQTDRWGASVTQTTKQTYQRAYLEYLASHNLGSVQ